MTVLRTSLRLSRNIQVELENHTILDQIVSFAGINKTEVFPIDCEFGVDRNISWSDLNCRRKTDRLLDAMKIKIAGDRMRRSVSSVWLDLRRNEVRFRIFRDIKKIRCL